MKNMKSVFEVNQDNILLLENILKTNIFEYLVTLRTKDGSPIQRAENLYQDYIRLINGIHLLKHDLRDDYKNDFELTIKG